MEKYQFIKQIGSGRYGDVWLVKGSKTKRNYVLKRIDFHQSAKREQRAAHLEAKLLCTVRHPNIVTYIDSFHNSKGSLFIVMGYCEHINMYDIIKDRNGIHFEEDEIIKWIVQICMALKYLHDQSILHRDIKTENIFLVKQKLIKIGNFRITRIFNFVEDVSSTLISTPCYTSPEVLLGEQFEQKSDVWSLGCCIYEMALLKHAFIAQDISTLVYQAIHSKLSAVVERYSSELFNITLSMLNIDAKKRPSVTELLLNDYIRKHILNCLQNSSRSNSSLSCSCKLSYQRNLKGISESTSTLFSGESKNKGARNKIRGAFKTIPDVNGNGDANDNSQHEATDCENSFTKTKLSIDRLSEKSLVAVTCDDTCSWKSSPELGKPLFTKCHIANMKQFEKRLNMYAQKIKSENSFQFLNTITNSMNISRFKSLDSFDKDFQLKSMYTQIPPKSAEDLASISKTTDSYLLRRPATSAEANFDVICNDFNSFCLPKIKESCFERNISTVNDLNINLPPLHNSLQVQCENVSALENKSLPNLGESVVDKFLLRNILECNKTTQIK